jgi:phosphate transport system substrate-binding protein
MAGRRLGLLVLCGLGLSACTAGGGSSGEAGSSSSAARDPIQTTSVLAGIFPGGSALGGREVVVSGSSTVEPISKEVAKSYQAQHPDVKVSVSGPGTDDGFKLFCVGKTDISDASRPIKDAEAQTCAANGILYRELKVGVDGITVLTSAANQTVDCLTFADLYALIGPESVGFNNWSAANALDRELGGKGQLPTADLVIIAPGTESGTYDSFIQIALSPTAKARSQEATTRPDYSSTADDEILVQKLAQYPTSLGWVGFDNALSRPGIKPISVARDLNSECVPPNPQTIASNSYPLSRPLYIYVNQANARSNPAVADFVDHYVTYGLDTATSLAGLIELSDEAKLATRSSWSSR